MKTSTALILQTAIALFGIATLAFMFVMPHFEGRNAHATVFEVYFKDPFLAYACIGSIPFFLALYRAFKLFGQVRQTGAFSPSTVAALRTIKRCAFVLIAFVAGAIVFILMAGDGDDRPQGIVMGLFVILCSGIVATVAALFARNLQNTLSRSGLSRG